MATQAELAVVKARATLRHASPILEIIDDPVAAAAVASALNAFDHAVTEQSYMKHGRRMIAARDVRPPLADGLWGLIKSLARLHNALGAPAGRRPPPAPANGNGG